MKMVWMRRDLRLEDNAALEAAISHGDEFVCVYIDETSTPLGSAEKVWAHHSLIALQASIRDRRGILILKRGDPSSVLLSLANTLSADTVLWNRRYEPDAIAADAETKATLEAGGVKVLSFPGNVLIEPWKLSNNVGKPYQVYTPFWKAVRAAYSAPEFQSLPARFRAPGSDIESLTISELEYLPRISWDRTIHETWECGEMAARTKLNVFLDRFVTSYPEHRDIPSRPATSRLSPYLHFGEISPHRVWKAVFQNANRKSLPHSHEVFLKQLVWREFGHHLLFHFPETVSKPLRVKFEKFPWQSDRAAFLAWCEGRTGYPLVDAGMRELWATGWMHNRVRMIVASFLVKHLLIPWQQGAAWFMDTLVDADLANNTLGWQWTAGCGADAAPYFRIFNPVLQGEKFDPRGEYVARWVPELKDVPPKWIHQPWRAPVTVLSSAGLVLGRDYPHPIVEHAFARDRALEAFEVLGTADITT